jgi:hypothetical protein
MYMYDTFHLPSFSEVGKNVKVFLIGMIKMFFPNFVDDMI